jgi:hypothetical protein
MSDLNDQPLFSTATTHIIVQFWKCSDEQEMRRQDLPPNIG